MTDGTDVSRNFRNSETRLEFSVIAIYRTLQKVAFKRNKSAQDRNGAQNTRGVNGMIQKEA